MNRNVLLGLAGLGIGLGLMLMGGKAEAAMPGPAKPPEPEKKPGGGGASPPAAKPPVTWDKPKQPTVAPPAGKTKEKVPGGAAPATMPGGDTPTGTLIADLVTQGFETKCPTGQMGVPPNCLPKPPCPPGETAEWCATQPTGAPSTGKGKPETPPDYTKAPASDLQQEILNAWNVDPNNPMNWPGGVRPDDKGGQAALGAKGGKEPEGQPIASKTDNWSKSKG